MTDFSKNERVIALFLSKFPFLKLVLKKIYQRLSYLLYKKQYKYRTEYDIKEISFDNEETFFGYYDNSPLNFDGEYIIFHSVLDSTKKLPDSKKEINIVLKSFVTNEVLNVFKTKAYNWQQGSKLQWVSNNEFIFNDFDETNERYVSKVVTINNDKSIKIKQYNYPIYDTFNDVALTLNYNLLAKLRPDYGYRNKSYQKKSYLNEGVFKFSLLNKTDDYKLLISLDQLIDLDYNKNMDGAEHKVNHIMINPNGDSFVFLHRYILNGRRFDRLIFSDINGGNLKVLAQDDMVSHFYWKNNNEIIVYMRDFNLGDKYYQINIATYEKVIIGNGSLDLFGDGHPNIYKNLMVYDTYPNKSRMKSLYVYNFNTKSNDLIGEFYESFNFYGETRCDLHPRWSYDGKFIFIDSVHSQKRKLYCISYEG